MHSLVMLHNCRNLCNITMKKLSNKEKCSLIHLITGLRCLWVSFKQFSRISCTVTSNIQRHSNALEIQKKVIFVFIINFVFGRIFEYIISHFYNRETISSKWNVSLAGMGQSCVCEPSHSFYRLVKNEYAYIKR